MAQKIRRSYTAVRAYSEQLRRLTSQLMADPLNEQKSLALVLHIVNNRSAAAELFDALETQAMGVSC